MDGAQQMMKSVLTLLLAVGMLVLYMNSVAFAASDVVEQNEQQILYTQPEIWMTPEENLPQKQTVPAASWLSHLSTYIIDTLAHLTHTIGADSHSRWKPVEKGEAPAATNNK